MNIINVSVDDTREKGLPFLKIGEPSLLAPPELVCAELLSNVHNALSSFDVTGVLIVSGYVW